jgi:hypothetical protein
LCPWRDESTTAACGWSRLRAGVSPPLEIYDSAEAFAEHRRCQHFRQNIETMRAPLLIERECGFAGYIDNTVRDGEGSVLLIPAEATDRGAR